MHWSVAQRCIGIWGQVKGFEAEVVNMGIRLLSGNSPEMLTQVTFSDTVDKNDDWKFAIFKLAIFSWNTLIPVDSGC